MNTTKCTSCEAEINENDFVALTQDGEEYCESCEQNAWEYPNTIYTMKNGEKTKYLWCSPFGFRNAEYWEEESPNGVEGFKYHRTDGWRGYWDTEIQKGYIPLASGWSTGKWSDVAYKHTFNDFVDDILDGTIECPYELIFSFALTSNVFSVSSDVIIKESDLDSFTEWLIQETGYNVDDLKKALK
jgi:hypothetical protein